MLDMCFVFGISLVHVCFPKFHQEIPVLREIFFVLKTPSLPGVHCFALSNHLIM